MRQFFRIIDPVAEIVTNSIHGKRPCLGDVIGMFLKTAGVIHRTRLDESHVSQPDITEKTGAVSDNAGTVRVKLIFHGLCQHLVDGGISERTLPPRVFSDMRENRIRRQNIIGLADRENIADSRFRISQRLSVGEIFPSGNPDSRTELLHRRPVSIQGFPRRILQAVGVRAHKAPDVPFPQIFGNHPEAPLVFHFQHIKPASPRVGPLTARIFHSQTMSFRKFESGSHEIAVIRTDVGSVEIPRGAVVAARGQRQLLFSGSGQATCREIELTVGAIRIKMLFQRIFTGKTGTQNCFIPIALHFKPILRGSQNPPRG